MKINSKISQQNKNLLRISPTQKLLLFQSEQNSRLKQLLSKSYSRWNDLDTRKTAKMTWPFYKLSCIMQLRKHSSRDISRLLLFQGVRGKYSSRISLTFNAQSGSCKDTGKEENLNTRENIVLYLYIKQYFAIVINFKCKE